MDDSLRDFVSTARVARLATASPDGRPHVVPVCFALVGDLMYIALDDKPKRVPPERLRRVRNIIANPQAQLLVDRYDEDWSRLAFVQVTGRASLLLAGGPGHREALTVLRDKYPQYRQMVLEERPLIRIEIERAQGWTAGSTYGSRQSLPAFRG